MEAVYRVRDGFFSVAKLRKQERLDCVHLQFSPEQGDTLSNRSGRTENITTYNLARMNMLLHGVNDTEIEIFHGNTLSNKWDTLRVQTLFPRLRSGHRLFQWPSRKGNFLAFIAIS